jgi:hypothetical protein
MHVELLEWQPNGVWHPCTPDRPSPAGSAPHSAASLVLYFGQTDLLGHDRLYAGLRERFPGALIAGCSTDTPTLGDRLDEDGVVAAAIGFEHTAVRAVCEPIADASQSRACGLRLGEQLRGDELSLVLVLCDGSRVNGTQLVEGLGAALGPRVRIVGGLAGDGARFETTLVGLQGPARTAQVVAIGLYGSRLRHGAAAAGGWDAFGPPRRVTRSQGNVLFELDGKPALELYERYLGDEADGLPGTALLYPLRIWQPDHDETDLVRTVLAIDRDARSMTFAGDIPQGWSAQLMRGNHDRLVAGAEQAARLAVAELPAAQGDGAASLALLVSCVGRRLLMGQRTVDEVDAVQRAVHETLGPQTRCIGFYSHGELAPRASSGLCELHNQTMTVTVLTESMA